MGDDESMIKADRICFKHFQRLNLQSKSNSETDEYEKINNDGLCLMKKEIQRMSASQLEARKAELELWRQQRGEMKRQEEEIKRQAEIEAKQAQMKMIKKKQAELRNKITAYKEEKMAEKLENLRCLAIQAESERLIRQRQVTSATDRIQQRVSMENCLLFYLFCFSRACFFVRI
ncbi:unnamed protein product [Trichobilharzia regenti]|nr:unnamed protein product [Trichobilharzia regenti]